MPVSPNWPGLQNIMIASDPRRASRLSLPVVAAIHDAHAFLPSEAGEATVARSSALSEAEANHETQEGQGRPHDQRTVGRGEALK